MRKYLMILVSLGLVFILSSLIFAGNSPIPGDVNGDGKVDIVDAINALQIIDSINQTVNINADVNSNGKIGVEEAIFLLQVISGIRPLPPAPSLLTAGTITSSSIAMTWIDNSSDESGFRIERKTGAAGTYAQVGSVAANATGFTDTGLMAATTYVYRVYAYNANGNSGYSNEITVPTAQNPGPSPTDTLAYAKAMVVGAWYYAGRSSTCKASPYPSDELNIFICPGGRIRGFERLRSDSSHIYDFVAKGTYSINRLFSGAARIDLNYTTEINIGGEYSKEPGTLASENAAMYYDQKYDYIVYWYNTCWRIMLRTEDGTNKDVDNSYCGTTVNPAGECGTDSDCGRCWYCDKSGSSSTCRYGGEGPYGCYRGWEPPD